MGLFDKLSRTKDIQLSPKGALALAAMTIIGADGSIEDDELAGLQRIVRGDGEAFDQAYKLYKDKPIQDCVEIVTKTLDQKQKVAVIANLLDLAMADGMLAGAEEKLLTAYVNNFQLSDDVVKSIIDVIEVKNNFAIFE